MSAARNHSPNEGEVPLYGPRPSVADYSRAQRLHDLHRQRDNLRTAIFLEARGSAKRIKLEKKMAELTLEELRLEKARGQGR